MPQSWTFNSPYLGFFLASLLSLQLLRQTDFSFQFPLLGIFPCIYTLQNWFRRLQTAFQFPLLGIFPCIILSLGVTQFGKTITFNSPYLGFFLASSLRMVDSVTVEYFQFPLLGIFPCILKPSVNQIHKRWTFNSPYLGFFLASWACTHICAYDLSLSIPLTWDFSLHPCWTVQERSCDWLLSIPLTWDFSLHRMNLVSVIESWKTFNSPYLGFFLASASLRRCGRRYIVIFQFPLLGIFPCILQ